MNWWVNITKVPFVSVAWLITVWVCVNLGNVRRKLAIWMAVPFSSEKVYLLLCKIWIDHGKWDTVKGGVPGGEEGILPRVRHR